MKVQVVAAICFVTTIAVGWIGFKFGYRAAQLDIGDQYWHHCMDDTYWGQDGPRVEVCGWEFPKSLGFEDPRRR